MLYTDRLYECLPGRADLGALARAIDWAVVSGLRLVATNCLDYIYLLVARSERVRDKSFSTLTVKASRIKTHTRLSPVYSPQSLRGEALAPRALSLSHFFNLPPTSPSSVKPFTLPFYCHVAMFDGSLFQEQEPRIPRNSKVRAAIQLALAIILSLLLKNWRTREDGKNFSTSFSPYRSLVSWFICFRQVIWESTISNQLWR